MAKGEFLEREIVLYRDGVLGTFEWIKSQGVTDPMVLQKIKVIAQMALKLGMLISVYNSDKFREGIEDELQDEDIYQEVKK